MYRAGNHRLSTDSEREGWEKGEEGLGGVGGRERWGEEALKLRPGQVTGARMAEGGEISWKCLQTHHGQGVLFTGGNAKNNW